MGVRGRLLLAFMGVSAFVLIATIAAMYAFSVVEGALVRITEERVPTVLDALTLSRQAESVIVGAPKLLAVADDRSRQSVWDDVSDQLSRLRDLLDGLEGEADPVLWAELRGDLGHLAINLSDLNRMVERRLELAEERDAVARRVLNAGRLIRRTSEPAKRLLELKLARWRALQTDPSAGPFGSELAKLADAFDDLLPQQQAELIVGVMGEMVFRVVAAQDHGQLSLLSQRVDRSLTQLEELARGFLPKLQARVEGQLRLLRGAVLGPQGLIALRGAEIDALQTANAILDQNAEISTSLTQDFDRLMADVRADIEASKAHVVEAQTSSTLVLLIVAVASLVCSALVVWLYVHGDLLRRLSALSRSMKAVAGGNLRVPLPRPLRHDEIDDMTRALTVFRDTAVDIEERGLREVDRARQRLVDAIESTSEGFALYDASDRLVLCNTIYKQMLYGDADVDLAPGTPFEAVLRRAVENKLIGEVIDDPEGYIQARLAQHRATGQPVLQHRSDGRWMLMSERRVTGGGTVAVYSDVTELKRTEEALLAAKEQAEEANRAKSEFLANMSHELRTPMNAIIGFTRLVMRRGNEVLPERQVANLDKILASANHLLSLINNILDLSKIEARRVEVQPATFEVAPLIDQCLRTVEPMLNGERVALRKQVAPDLPPLFNDEDKIRQILINLLSNAAKFTEAGTITVRAQRCGEAVELTVADTGIGIPEAAQELVFEEFRQVDNSSTRRYGGTGLGLAISRQLAILLGGELTMHSELGAGSTFTLSVPIRCGPQAAPETAAAAAVRPAEEITIPAQAAETATVAPAVEPGERLVLAIDDDPDMIMLLRENLAEAGYRVIGATGGQEGLEKARQLRPSVITLDIILPDVDGWQVLHQLKTDPATRDIPVVVLTVVDQAHLGRRPGVAAYIVKPFERDQLVGTLERVAPCGRRLLVVDDDPDVADLVRQLLEDEGYTIDAAEDGVAALRTLEQCRPDAILLDLLMPRMDGFDVIRRLREDAERRDIPVIVLTAKELSRKERRLLRKHTLAIIAKDGLDRAALVAQLKQIVPGAICPTSNDAAA